MRHCLDETCHHFKDVLYVRKEDEYKKKRRAINKRLETYEIYINKIK